jgi:transcriptional regulator with XRE-family HTH domain
MDTNISTNQLNQSNPNDLLPISEMSISRAELARRLGVSRTYITLLAQGKRTPSQDFVDRFSQLAVGASCVKPVDSVNSNYRLQIRRGALIMSSVGSTPMRSRQILLTRYLESDQKSFSRRND